MDIKEKESKKQERTQKLYNEQHKIENGEVYKRCNSHKEFFPNEDEWSPCTEEYFYKNKINGLDGLYPYCKKCSIKKMQGWRKDNPEKYKLDNAEYKKNHHEEVIEFTKNWRKENDQHVKDYIKQYQLDNTEKLRGYGLNRAIKNHDITSTEWISCKEYFKNEEGIYICAYCGLPITEHYNMRKGISKLFDLHKEHVDDDGLNDLSNCVPSCVSCNSQKWNFDMEEWYQQQDFFSNDRLNKIYKWINEDCKQFYIEKQEFPYIIKRKRNEDNKTYHSELWSKDEKGKLLECLGIAENKKGLNIYIKKYYNNYSNNN